MITLQHTPIRRAAIRQRTASLPAFPPRLIRPSDGRQSHPLESRSRASITYANVHAPLPPTSARCRAAGRGLRCKRRVASELLPPQKRFELVRFTASDRSCYRASLRYRHEPDTTANVNVVVVVIVIVIVTLSCCRDSTICDN